MSEYFEKMRQGLQDCIDYENGDKTKAVERIRSIPDPVFKPADVARLRKDLNMTQRGMATVMGVSARTVEAWETGRSNPSGTASRMLYLIDQDHDLVHRLIK